MATLKEQLIARTEEWLRKTGYAPSTFGLAVSNDPRLLQRLKDGGKISTDVYESAMAYLDAHWNDKKQSWPKARSADFNYAKRRGKRKAA